MNQGRESPKQILSLSSQIPTLWRFQTLGYCLTVVLTLCTLTAPLDKLGQIFGQSLKERLSVPQAEILGSKMLPNMFPRLSQQVCGFYRLCIGEGRGLMNSVYCGSIVEFLLRQPGVDVNSSQFTVNCQDTRGRTALHCSALQWGYWLPAFQQMVKLKNKFPDTLPHHVFSLTLTPFPLWGSCSCSCPWSSSSSSKFHATLPSGQLVRKHLPGKVKDCPKSPRVLCEDNQGVSSSFLFSYTYYIAIKIAQWAIPGNKATFF